MMSIVYTKSYTPPPVNLREVLRYAGVTGKDERAERLILELLPEVLPRLSCKVCYASFPLSMSGESLDLGFSTVTSHSLSRALSGCERTVVFAATLGIDFDRLLVRYGKISSTKQLLLQAIGAERIESLCDLFCRELAEDQARAGKRVRPRFSAGYGDLPLAMQREIFAALDCPKHIGLTLNDSLLMSPTKSVTAIVGISGE